MQNGPAVLGGCQKSCGHTKMVSGWKSNLEENDKPDWHFMQGHQRKGTVSWELTQRNRFSNQRQWQFVPSVPLKVQREGSGRPADRLSNPGVYRGFSMGLWNELCWKHTRAFAMRWKDCSILACLRRRTVLTFGIHLHFLSNEETRSQCGLNPGQKKELPEQIQARMSKRDMLVGQRWRVS